MKLEAILKEGREHLKVAGIENYSLEAEVILAYLLGKGREFLYSHPEGGLSGDTYKCFQQLISRRIHYLPLAYITGYKEFMSLDFKVNKNVMIPRPETEILVEETLKLLEGGELFSNQKRLPIILDIGTGCGNIALSLAKLASSFVYGADISEKALEVAKDNRKRLGLEDQVVLVQSDLWEYFRDRRWRRKMDVVVSNPPYVKTAELPVLSPEVSFYEPKEALDGGKDGLKFFPEIIEGGKFLLKKGGYLILEVGYGQARKVRKMIEDTPAFAEIKIKKDYGHFGRVIITRRR